MKKLRIGLDFGKMSSRGRFATPADFPLRDCSPYLGQHVRRESVGSFKDPFSVAPWQTLVLPTFHAAVCTRDFRRERAGLGEAGGGVRPR
jgi:hypothetical protein